MAEDRVSAFLAREKENLGDLTDELFNDAGNGSGRHSFFAHLFSYFLSNFTGTQ